MSILYIDDDIEDIEIFEEAIKAVDPSIQYSSATSGKEAIELLNKTDNLPDHIILDINMPGMDGRSCLKEIRKHKRFDPINVIVYSTAGFPNDVAQVNAMRATFMLKATSFTELCKMVKGLVDQRVC